MTLFFINRERHLFDAFDDEHKLVWAADVIVIVGRDDEWITTKDRLTTHGQVVHPRRRAELLDCYYTVIRPTSFNDK